MDILAISIALTIGIGPAFEPVSYTLDVNPVVGITLDYATLGAAARGGRPGTVTGTTIGPVIFRNRPAFEHFTTRYPNYEAEFYAHELRHTRQWNALGPAFLPLYLLSPDTFEPYDLAHPGRPGTDDFDTMWMPDDDMAASCPTMRFTWGAPGEAASAALMPCYEMLSIHTR